MPKDNLTVKEKTNNVPGDESFPAVKDDRHYYLSTQHLDDLLETLCPPGNIGNDIDFDIRWLVLAIFAKAAAQKATKEPSISNVDAAADMSRRFRATLFPKPKKPEEWGDTLVKSQLDGYFHKK